LGLPSIQNGHREPVTEYDTNLSVGADIVSVKRPTKWRWLPAIIALPISVVIYGLVNLTPDPQYSLLSAAGAFIILSMVPVAQTWLAVRQAELMVRQTELAELMNRRDAERFAQEQAAAKQKADLVIALESGYDETFWPVGGHVKPNEPIAFLLYIDNLGDAPAKDVGVYIGLPPWAHAAPYTLPTYGDEPAVMSASRPISFDTNLLHPHLGQPVGVAQISSVYPKPRRHPIGLMSVTMPPGKYRFQWAIESSAGQFKSNDTNQISIQVNDTAAGHDVISNFDGNTERCRYCSSLKRYPIWISLVNTAIDKRRWNNGTYNPKPQMMQGGLQVQWYQELTGPGRWITCEVAAEMTSTVRAYFWTNGHQEERRTELTDMNDPERFANAVWEFLGEVP
jgi:hypothetical protein